MNRTAVMSSMTMKARCFFSYVLLVLIATVETQKGPLLLRYCRNKNDCGGTFGYVCGQNQTCHCDRFYVINSYGDKCVGGVGQQCRYDEHCIEGAFCEYQIRCQCKEELYPSEDGLACSKSKQIVSSEPHLYAIAALLIYLLKV